MMPVLRLAAVTLLASTGCLAHDAPAGAPSPDDAPPPGASWEDAHDLPAVFASDGPLPSTCSTAPLAPATFPGSFELGAFTVTIDAHARIAVDHVEGGAEQRSAHSGPPFTASQSSLEVEERQGSFDVDIEVHTTCQDPTLDALRHGDRGLEASGRFGDCPELGWSLRLCEAADGQLWFALSTTDADYDDLRLRLASDAGERIYGMGEQFPHDRLDLKGRAIPVLSQEGGIGRGHIPITQGVNLVSPGSGGSQASTYYAAPHYLTTRMRSAFLENTEYAIFDFRADEVTELRAFAPAMRGRFVAGSSPLQLIERFTAWAGRMPPLPEWVNQGAIVALARDLDDSRAIVADLRARGAAIAAVWNQTWSGKAQTFIGEQVLWNWVQNPSFHPEWPGFVAELARDGIRTLCYINPMLVDPPADAGPVRRNLFAEAVAGDYFVKNQRGDVYLMPVTAFDVGLIDLTNAEARAWLKAVMREEMIERAGCSGWMADFAEALPFDAVLSSGIDAASYHNQYPVDWIRLNREVAEDTGLLGDLLIFNRSGAARTPRYSMLLWQGDQLTTWDKYDGLVSAIRGLLNGGFSGIALNHSDTGGYTSLSVLGILGYRREAEQLKRWTEMNAFTAALRTHEGNQPGENAQIYSSSGAMDHFARFTKVYRALAFYREQLFDDAAARGWPVVRHLWMEFPDDERAQTVNDQFMLGSEIIVAPIKNKCWTIIWCPYIKKLYLPEGEWAHLWSGRVYAGAGTIKVRAPIGEPAVFYRAGSAVGAQLVQNLQAEGLTVADPT